jgi:L-fuculose-phosphate aldolase
VTIGQSLMNAYYKMETVEHFAKISLVARQLGNENVFSPARAQELVDARARYGVQAGAGCRIEHKNASYAPEVPMSGASAAGYAQENKAPRGSVTQAGSTPGAGNGNGAELDLSESEVAQLVQEIARRVVSQVKG